MAVRKALVEASGVTRQIASGDTLEGPQTCALSGSQTGTSALVIGAVYLTSGQVLSTASRALMGTGAGGTATLNLRRQTTAVLLSGASWAVTGAIADVALGSPVTVVNTDWYTIELSGSAGGTVSLAYGLVLVP